MALDAEGSCQIAIEGQQHAELEPGSGPKYTQKHQVQRAPINPRSNHLNAEDVTKRSCWIHPGRTSPGSAPQPQRPKESGIDDVESQGIVGQAAALHQQVHSAGQSTAKGSATKGGFEAQGDSPTECPGGP